MIQLIGAISFMAFSAFLVWLSVYLTSTIFDRVGLLQFCEDNAIIGFPIALLSWGSVAFALFYISYNYFISPVFF